MLKKIAAFVEQHHMLLRGDHVLAGVSGGADSVCLLLVLLELLKQYRLTLTVVHVEHGIRGEDSRRDAAFVESLCARLGVELKVFHEDAVAFSREHGMTLEEGARELRYQRFSEVSNKVGANRIAVAHNQNDSGETLLFHLARGSGLKGMCGIVPVRGEIIRPLLCVSRQEIEVFLRERGQEFCTDATNRDILYSRNKIRHQVLPLLTEINAGAVEHLYQSTRYVSEAMELVEELVQKARAGCVAPARGEAAPGAEAGWEYREQTGQKSIGGKAGFLVGERLWEEPPLIQRTLVMELMAELAGSRKDISTVHVEQTLKLFSRQVGRRLDLPYEMEASRTYDGILLRRKEEGEEGERRPKMQVEPGKTVEILPGGPWMRARILEKTGEFQEIPKKTYTKWFDYDKIKNTLWLRTRESEDYFDMDSRGRRQSLRRYFINEKVSMEIRDTVPVLAEGSHVLWIVGYRISEAYKVTKETGRVLEVQVYGGNIHE